MKVTICGHAGLAFEDDRDFILLDPILRTSPLTGGLVHAYPRLLTHSAIPTPSFLVITHAHFDHFDPESLLSLPKSVPVVLPPDRRLERDMRRLGFDRIMTLGAFETYKVGKFTLTATPSGAEVVEFGLLVEHSGRTFWHMSDAEASPEVAARLVGSRGRVDVVSAKFQPADPQLNYLHNQGTSFDRPAVAQWLEAACLCEPELIFPYASGLCFAGSQRWLNRYAYPFSPEHVVSLLRARTEERTRADEMRPGDVISLASDGVRVSRQASPFVRHAPEAQPSEWEPFDAAVFQTNQSESAERLVNVLRSRQDYLAWCDERARPGSPLALFRELGVVWQLVVHLAAGRRSYSSLKFDGGPLVFREGQLARANYFTHIGSDAFVGLVTGATKSLEVMLSGQVRIFERILKVDRTAITGRNFARPYAELPDPLLTFPRWHRDAS